MGHCELLKQSRIPNPPSYKRNRRSRANTRERWDGIHDPCPQASSLGVLALRFPLVSAGAIAVILLHLIDASRSLASLWDVLLVAVASSPESVELDRQPWYGAPTISPFPFSSSSWGSFRLFLFSPSFGVDLEPQPNVEVPAKFGVQDFLDLCTFSAKLVMQEKNTHNWLSFEDLMLQRHDPSLHETEEEPRRKQKEGEEQH
ncbi:hypothetical protein OPV22_018924 [Ensete ventricosum]|uniref:Uncharacterized protein n=1 Tax=Ensete ventricosum TaxID=4639 RepID=A0AAV8R1B0_ENSVE|nr:hypothetical protein OPV22_018924 [Ensete ventricosum]